MKLQPSAHQGTQVNQVPPQDMGGVFLGWGGQQTSSDFTDSKEGSPHNKGDLGRKRGWRFGC